MSYLIGMMKPGDIRYAEEMLREAMELLADMYDKLGMFELQRYGELQKRFRQHEALDETMRTGLNVIETQ